MIAVQGTKVVAYGHSSHVRHVTEGCRARTDAFGLPPRHTGPMLPDPTAHLQVIADHVDRYQEEVGSLVPNFHAAQQDDVATALVEAERALRTASRLVRRAAKLTGTM